MSRASRVTVEGLQSALRNHPSSHLADLQDRIAAIHARWIEYAALAEDPRRVEHWRRCAAELAKLLEETP